MHGITPDETALILTSGPAALFLVVVAGIGFVYGDRDLDANRDIISVPSGRDRGRGRCSELEGRIWADA